MTDRMNKSLVQGIHLLEVCLHNPTPQTVAQIAHAAGDNRHPTSIKRDLDTLAAVGWLEMVDKSYVPSGYAFQILAACIRRQNEILADARDLAQQAYETILNLNQQIGAVR